MLVTLAIVIAVLAAAALIAARVNNRPPDVPTAPQYATPQQLDRSEYAHPEVPWLFVLFSSATCLACRDARDALRAVDELSPTNRRTVEVLDLAAETSRDIHSRYRIDAVPTLVLADADGVVRWSYLGAPPIDEIRDVLVDVGLAPGADGTAVNFP